MLVQLFLFTFIAEVAGTLAGFGSSTILLPLMLFLFEFKTALVLVAIAHLSGNLLKLKLFSKKIDFNILVGFGIPSVIFALIGANFAGSLNQEILKKILGIILILFSLRALASTNSFSITRNFFTELLGGGLSGFFAGLVGTGGAIRSLFLVSFNLKKDNYIFTLALAAILADIARIPVYLKQDFLGASAFQLVPAVFVFSILGTICGKVVVDRIDEEKFRKVVLVAIFLAGINLFRP